MSRRFLPSLALGWLVSCSSGTNQQDGGLLMDLLHAGPDLEMNQHDLAPLADLSPGPDIAGQCNAVANTAPVVQQQQVAQNPPAAAGGTVADGIYYATAYTIYTGPGGATGPNGQTIQLTLSKSGGTLQEVVGTLRINGTISQSGTSLNVAYTCQTGAAPGAGLTPYSVVGSTLIAYGSGPPPYAITLSKQ